MNFSMVQFEANHQSQVNDKHFQNISPYGLFTAVYSLQAEPEFLNFLGAQESIPTNQFRQAV
jgi:hypothetical protein